MDVPRLHLISDRKLCPLDMLPDVATRAAAGGVDAVHLREKDLCARDLVNVAVRLRSTLSAQTMLFINDRVDVALASGADGVELGEASLPVDAVEKVAGRRLVIGRSVHDVDGALRAEADGADFVIAGHVFETASKAGQAGRGLAFVESVASAVSIPVIAIGGITPERVPDVLSAGAHGVAVLSGILAVNDPEAAARRYAQAFG